MKRKHTQKKSANRGGGKQIPQPHHNPFARLFIETMADKKRTTYK